MKSNGHQQVGGNGTGMAIPVMSKDDRDAVISNQAVKIAQMEKAIELRNLRLQESHERADFYKARNEDLERKLHRLEKQRAALLRQKAEIPKGIRRIFRVRARIARFVGRLTR